MLPDFVDQWAALTEMSVQQLRARYQQLFGQPAHCRHRQYLLRRLAWRLQVLREGDVSAQARRRADGLGAAELSALAGTSDQDDAHANGTAAPGHRRRRPLTPGTVIRRAYKGRMITVQVLEKGFVYESRTYRSLTAVAKAVSGSHWNGYHFFGLASRKARR